VTTPTLPDLTALQAELDTVIFRELPTSHPHPDLERFYALLRNYPERGGKRLRGLVLLLSAAAHGAPWRAGLGVAAALELFQNWVLIHDDIEDDSEDRRGLPALHKQVGLPVALNVGDALHIYMWRTLLRSDFRSWAQQRRVVDAFEETISRTAEGQHLDLSWVAEGRFDISEHDYLEMVRLKSAHYTVVGPLTLGALCAEVEPDPSLHEAGLDLGVAFQIRDDVLNLMDDVSYGKEFAGDLFEAKRTLVLAHFFAHAAPGMQDEVRAILAKPRSVKTHLEVARVLMLLRETGSLRYAQEVAEAKAATGLAVLHDALTPLPGQAEASAILYLLGEVAHRRS
jgi:geranylgeranyl diphosphate synthase type II